LWQHRQNLLKKVTGTAKQAVTDAPICVTLKPMVLRGSFIVTRVWSKYSSILYVVMVVGMPLSVVGAPSVMQ
jgi:hypothetical protein